MVLPLVDAGVPLTMTDTAALAWAWPEESKTVMVCGAAAVQDAQVMAMAAAQSERIMVGLSPWGMPNQGVLTMSRLLGAKRRSNSFLAGSDTPARSSSSRKTVTIKSNSDAVMLALA